MITLFKYSQKNNKDLTKSYWNGKERIGYTSIQVSPKDADKYLAKGYTRKLPVKTVRKANVDKVENTAKSLKGDEG